MAKPEKPTIKFYLETIGANLEKIKPGDPDSAKGLTQAKEDLAELHALMGLPVCPGPGLYRKY